MQGVWAFNIGDGVSNRPTSGSDMGYFESRYTYRIIPNSTTIASIFQMWASRTNDALYIRFNHSSAWSSWFKIG